LEVDRDRHGGNDDSKLCQAGDFDWIFGVVPPEDEKLIFGVANVFPEGTKVSSILPLCRLQTHDTDT
jgi:hypothetical protein